MSNAEIVKAIQKISITILTGILGIVVFINTALIQQITLMGAEPVELQNIISGINDFSFVLLLISILFFIVAMPSEEVITSLKKLFKRDTQSINYPFIFYSRLICFVVGVTSFAVLFIVYLIKFAFIMV